MHYITRNRRQNALEYLFEPTTGILCVVTYLSDDSDVKADFLRLNTVIVNKMEMVFI